MSAGKEHQIALRLDQIEKRMRGKEFLTSDCQNGHDAKHCEQCIQMPLIFITVYICLFILKHAWISVHKYNFSTINCHRAQS